MGKFVTVYLVRSLIFITVYLVRSLTFITVYLVRSVIFAGYAVLELLRTVDVSYALFI